jgi:hypothetical protein
MFRRNFFRGRRGYSNVGRRRSFLGPSFAGTVILVSVAIVIIFYFMGYIDL